MSQYLYKQSSGLGATGINKFIDDIQSGISTSAMNLRAGLRVATGQQAPPIPVFTPAVPGTDKVPEVTMVPQSKQVVKAAMAGAPAIAAVLAALTVGMVIILKKK